MRAQTFVVTREVAWEFAFSILENARRLYESARLLHTHQLFGPAMSLAISSQEEQGKFLKVLLATSAAPESEMIEFDLPGHSKKQAIGAVVGNIESLVDWSPIAVDLSGIPTDSTSSVIRAVFEHLRGSVDKLQLQSDVLPSVEEQVKSAGTGEHERTRQRGLYADLVEATDGYRIQTPATVTVLDSEVEIERAAAFFAFQQAMAAAIRLPDSVSQLSAPNEQLLQDAIAKFWRQSNSPEQA